MKIKAFPVRDASGIIGHINVPVIESWKDIRKAQEWAGWSKKKLLAECNKAFIVAMQTEFRRQKRR